MNCPFCGSNALYEQYATLEGFIVPTIFCDTCKCIFTVEGSEDYVTGSNDGFARLREAWDTRDSRSCYADEVTHHDCKYSVNRGWCEHTCHLIRNEWGTPLTDQYVTYNCSKCGYTVDNVSKFVTYTPPNYCSHCGCKIEH